MNVLNHPLSLLCVALAWTACSHSSQAKRDDDKQKDSAASKQKEKKSESASAGATSQKKPTAPKVQGAEPITTSKTTEQMFKPEGLKKLQEALNGKLKSIEQANVKLAAKKEEMLEKPGDKVTQAQKKKEEQKIPLAKVEEVKANGELDNATQEALRSFQRSEQLPETGLPDYETLRRLDIKPNEVYHHQPPGLRLGVE